MSGFRTSRAREEEPTMTRQLQGTPSTRQHGAGREGHLRVNPMFTRDGETTTVPKHRFPAGPMHPGRPTRWSTTS